MKYDPQALKRLGFIIVARIKRRTEEENVDRYGKPFKPYSARPFAMPSGATTKRARAVLYKDGGIQYFRSPASEKLWIVVLGGYRALKDAEFAKAGGAGNVNLSRTGSMLRSLTVTGVNAETGTITIGFSRVDAAQKAKWNIDKGRDFLGITDDELASSAEFVNLLASSITITV